MTLRGEHREVIVEWVNYLLDRLFDSVAGDKQAENGLKHELRLQEMKKHHRMCLVIRFLKEIDYEVGCLNA